MRTMQLISAAAVSTALLAASTVAVLAQDEASEPMTPAFFEEVEGTDDGIVTTDPRFSGTFVANDPDIYPIGHGYDHVSAGLVHLQNEEGAWRGWTTGFSWMDKTPWHEQMWFTGEGAYEGLSVVAVSGCDRLPCNPEDTRFEGIIFEGDIPPLWMPAE